MTSRADPCGGVGLLSTGEHIRKGKAVRFGRRYERRHAAHGGAPGLEGGPAAGALAYGYTHRFHFGVEVVLPPKARLTEGTYGQCDACGEPIDDDRLAFRPWSTRCIEHA